MPCSRHFVGQADDFSLLTGVLELLLILLVATRLALLCGVMAKQLLLVPRLREIPSEAQIKSNQGAFMVPGTTFHQ